MTECDQTLIYDHPVRMIRVAVACGLAGILASCSISAAPNESAPPTADVSPQPIAVSKVKPRTIRHGPRSVNRVAITLDADYSPSAAEHVDNGTYPRQVNTAAIKFLEESKTPATVFVTGMWAQKYSEYLQRLARNPIFELGNHTWNHDAWTRTCYGLPYVGSEEAKRDGLQKTNQVVKDLTGKTLFYARLPGLCHTKSDDQLIASEGLQSVNMDVSTTDAFATNAQEVAKGMLKQAKPGSIFLMHLNGAPNAPVTAEILRILVQGLKAKGLEPVTLEALLQK